MSKKYFISYTVYAGFGNLTEHHETFTSWSDLERFKRQLMANQLVDYGCIDEQTAQKEAA
ncbi:MAG: hypothetical protein ACJ73N_00585 [Bryobacteraceae bacterium]